jgi:hypothetical protein
VQKVLHSDGVDVVVGPVNSATALGVKDVLSEAKKLLIVTNAGAEDVTRAGRTPYIWRISFSNGQISAAMGSHLAASGLKDGVYAIAPDYAAGKEVIAGFKKAFEAGGGTLAGTATTPFGTTSDYQPFLTGIQQSGARATFCFFSGAEAITFVKQYQQFGLSSTIPLYGSGFLTEGTVLKQQAGAALGVQTTLHYRDQLDNPANAAFVKAYSDKYGESPSCFSVQSYDAANVLGRALGSATALDENRDVFRPRAAGSVPGIDTHRAAPLIDDGMVYRYSHRTVAIVQRAMAAMSDGCPASGLIAIVVRPNSGRPQRMSCSCALLSTAKTLRFVGVTAGLRTRSTSSAARAAGTRTRHADRGRHHRDDQTRPESEQCRGVLSGIG